MRYFIDKNGFCLGEVLVENPANPDKHAIVDVDAPACDPMDCRLVNGALQPFRSAARIVPQSVTRYQGRAALLQMGLLDDIDAFISALPIDTADAESNLANRLTKMAWSDALHFERASPMVTQIGTLTGMSEEQIDDLFIFAATIG